MTVQQGLDEAVDARQRDPAPLRATYKGKAAALRRKRRVPSSDIDLAPRSPGRGRGSSASGYPRSAGLPSPHVGRRRRARPGGGARLLHQPLARLALIVPQLLLIFTFFYWPAGAGALLGLHPGASVGRRQRVGRLRQFRRHAVATPSTGTRSSAASSSRREHRPRHGGRPGPGAPHRPRAARLRASTASVLVWPYAIAAPALGLAFRFILAPEAGFIAFVNHLWPGLWNPALDGADAMTCIVIAFAWKYVGYNFIFFLAALQAIPRSLIEAAAMDGARPAAAHARHPAAADRADPVLPGRHQPHRQLHRQLRHRRHHDPGRAGARHRPDGLQDLFRRLQRPRLLRRRRPEHHPDAARHRC